MNKIRLLLALVALLLVSAFIYRPAYGMKVMEKHVEQTTPDDPITVTVSQEHTYEDRDWPIIFQSSEQFIDPETNALHVFSTGQNADGHVRNP